MVELFWIKLGHRGKSWVVRFGFEPEVLARIFGFETELPTRILNVNGVMLLLQVVVLLIGTFLFFYIEQCAYPTQVSLSEVEKAYQDICSIALNSTGNSNGEDWTERLQTRVAEICNQTASATTPTKPSCDLDRRSFATWFGYSITVAFTIGKFK